jgi:hypothetical protein
MVARALPRPCSQGFGGANKNGKNKGEEKMGLKNEFEKWLVNIDGKSSNTAQQYKSSINSISRHYSQRINKTIDLYDINDISFMKGLAKDYGMGGKYQNFGQNGNSTHGHATIRNAIAAYARFIEYKNSVDKSKGNKINCELSIEDKFSSLVSLWKIYNEVKELLTKAMGGTETEEFAKRLVAKYYNTDPLTISNKNADLKTIGNKLILVKSRQVDIITATPIGVIRNWDFDILVVILFSKNCDILKAVAINSEYAKNTLKWDNYQKGYILTTSKDLLQNEKSVDITETLQKLINEHFQIEKIIGQINSKNGLDSIAKISFKLLTTDENKNKYYIYPANEELFKREAFESSGIFVGIIHHNGYIEYIERQVNKRWESSVYWNINSMPTKYRKLKHLSYANNLTVYACPNNINLKSNEQWLREIASRNRGKNARNRP